MNRANVRKKRPYYCKVAALKFGFYLFMYVFKFSETMPPKRACSCTRHKDVASEPDNAKVYKIERSKKLKRNVFEYLIGDGLLQPYHTYLCQKCYDSGLQKIQCESVEQEKEAKVYTFEEFL